MIVFRAPRPRDVRRIAAGMREMDRRECAAFGHDPAEALRLGALGSSLCQTIVLDHEPVAMFGVSAVDMLEGVGRPWMLATDAAYGARKAWLTLAAAHVELMQDAFPILENWAVRENVVSLGWLRRLGFQVDPEPKQMGAEFMLRFWRVRTPGHPVDGGIDGDVGRFVDLRRDRGA